MTYLDQPETTPEKRLAARNISALLTAVHCYISKDESTTIPHEVYAQLPPAKYQRDALRSALAEIGINDHGPLAAAALLQNGMPLPALSQISDDAAAGIRFSTAGFKILFEAGVTDQFGVIEELGKQRHLTRPHWFKAEARNTDQSRSA